MRKLEMEVAIQCELPVAKARIFDGFLIEDYKERRKFVRRIYALLIVQQMIALLAMECALYWPLDFIAGNFYKFYGVGLLTTYAAFYLISDQRRRRPWNYLVFGFITLTYVGHEFICAQYVGSTMVLSQPIFMVSQFGFLALFTKQPVVRFRNFTGICLISILFILYMSALTILTRNSVYIIQIRSLLAAFYMLYDLQRMLRGELCYSTLKSNEYIFAVSNIYIDSIMFFWELLRFVFFDIFQVYRFFKRCCRTEVC